MKFNTFENKKALYFIGIDQSMTHTGVTVLKYINDIDFEIIESFGIVTSADNTFEERVFKIKDKIIETLVKYDKNHTFISIEGLAFSPGRTNNRAMLFGLFSIILMHLYENEYRYEIVPPTTLKKRYTGSGKAKKEDMLMSTNDMEKIRLSEFSKLKVSSKKFEDIIDSFALAKTAFLL